MKKTAKKAVKTYILANERYGLYYAEIVKFDPKTRVATVRNCRHIARWYGKTGGITSLAAHGLCGPNAANSRIGAPCNATLAGIVNIFDVSAEARATFDDAIVS